MAKWKRATFHFFIYEVAEVLNVSVMTVERWANRDNVNLHSMNFSQLYQWVKKHDKD
jgi:DNA-binding transcriptional regulator YiaG